MRGEQSDNRIVPQARREPDDRERRPCGPGKSLDGWTVRRLWLHCHKRRRNARWKQLPERKLIDEYGLVRLISLVRSLNLR